MIFWDAASGKILEKLEDSTLRGREYSRWTPDGDVLLNQHGILILPRYADRLLP